MKSLQATLLFLALVSAPLSAAPPVHVWEKQELTFKATSQYRNPYTEVTVWVDLTGPGFSKRVYGFWDGGPTFRVRLAATALGTWRWKSGSSPVDPGLDGKSGSFEAVPWADTQKAENPLRHGFIRSTPNHHALEHADGTPFLAIGDTWYSVGSNRFRWFDDDRPRPIGPTAGFKDYVRLRKSQGYNWVNVIAAFPNWKTDDKGWHLVMDDSAHTTVRSAWLEFGTGSAKNMDNEGGRPFLFPGKVPGYEQYFPDMDRINPEYFKYFDRKVDYLNANGFIAFIESFRRDASELWMKYHAWPDSPARYMEYIRARYGAVAEEPVPERLKLDQVLKSDRANGRSWAAMVAAAAVVAFVVGGTAGWMARGASAAAPTGFDVFASEALDAYKLYVVEVRHPVEVPGNERAHMTQWLSKRLGEDLRIPDLQSIGLKLIGGRLLPGPTGAAAFYMYESPSGAAGSKRCQASQMRAPANSAAFAPIRSCRWFCT